MEGQNEQTNDDLISKYSLMIRGIIQGTGYEYNRFPDMDTYFTEINHVLLASRGYEYDGFLDFLNSIVFISLNDNL